MIFFHNMIHKHSYRPADNKVYHEICMLHDVQKKYFIKHFAQLKN